MKKLIAISLFASILMADRISLPMPASQLSVENNGTLSAVDAYNNGIGIYISGPASINNKSMNSLVFKYGAEAKERNTNLSNIVTEKGTNEEKALLSNLNIFKPHIPSEGSFCDDGNETTYNDKIVNGQCMGDVSNVNFEMLFRNGTSISGGIIDFENSQIYGYRMEGGGVLGYNSVNMQSIYDLGFREINYTVTSGTCGAVYIGRKGNIDYNNMNNTSYGTNNTKFKLNLDTRILTITGQIYNGYPRVIDVSHIPLDNLVIGISSIQASACWTRWSF